MLFFGVQDIAIGNIQAQPYKGIGMFALISMTPGVSDTLTLRDVRIDDVPTFPPASLFILGDSKVNDVGFMDFEDVNGGDYRLAKNGKFKGAAMDREDVGADIDAIEKATRGVK